MTATTTRDNEFEINPLEESGVGPMIVLDHRALLGDEGDSLLWQGDTNEFDAHWWVVSREGALPTKRQLDPVFSEFVNSFCYNSWVDADVYYYGANSDKLHTGLGFEDAHGMFTFHVHCPGSEKANTFKLLASVIGIDGPAFRPDSVFDWLKTANPTANPRRYVIVDFVGGESVVRGFEL